MNFTDKERERILSKINKTETCWLWMGYITKPRGRYKGGYGQVMFRKKAWKAHRLVYTLLVGPIEHPLVIDHLCRVKNCVNPKHLEPVDRLTNIARGDSPGHIGSKNHQSKLNETKVTEIIKLIQSGETNTAIGKKYGMSNVLISKIKLKQSWTHVWAAFEKVSK